jgi:subtilase-type serine protease
VLVSAGYGANGTGTNCCNPIDNKRRNMTIEFGAFVPIGAQPFLLAQFRDPLSPNNPNTFGLTVGTSPLEGGTAPGDSGGPVFIQTAAGLVQIGALQGGFNNFGPDGQYGDVSGWTPLSLFLDWLAQNNPLRKSRRRLETSIGATRRPGSMRFRTRRGLTGRSRTTPVEA